MKFLIDAQLPRRLTAHLKQAGFAATHTLELPEGNRTKDQTLVTISLSEQAVLVTKDSDFVQSFLLKREPWKLLLVSTGNISNDELLRLFELNIRQITDAFRTFDFIEFNRSIVQSALPEKPAFNDSRSLLRRSKMFIALRQLVIPLH